MTCQSHKERRTSDGDELRSHLNQKISQIVASSYSTTLSVHPLYINHCIMESIFTLSGGYDKLLPENSVSSVTVQSSHHQPSNIDHENEGEEDLQLVNEIRIAASSTDSNYHEQQQQQEEGGGHES